MSYSHWNEHRNNLPNKYGRGPLSSQNANVTPVSGTWAMRQLLSPVHLMFERQDADRLGDRRAWWWQEWAGGGGQQQQRQPVHSRQHQPHHGGQQFHPRHGEYLVTTRDTTTSVDAFCFVVDSFIRNTHSLVRQSKATTLNDLMGVWCQLNPHSRWKEDSLDNLIMFSL